MLLNKQNKKWFIAAICVVFLLACLLIYLAISPLPTPWYYGGLINKIGAPSGLVIDKTNGSNRQKWEGFGWSRPYARRFYSGEAEIDTTRSYMLNRLHSIGLSNAEWEENSGNIVHNSGIWATCQHTGIFIRIYQQKNVPLDIEVFKYASKNGPSCPRALPSFTWNPFSIL